MSRQRAGQPSTPCLQWAASCGEKLSSRLMVTTSLRAATTQLQHENQTEQIMLAPEPSGKKPLDQTSINVSRHSNMNQSCDHCWHVVTHPLMATLPSTHPHQISSILTSKLLEVASVTFLHTETTWILYVSLQIHRCLQIGIGEEESFDILKNFQCQI